MGWHGRTGYGNFCSKGAIHALTGQLAAEFGKDNIRVNTTSLLYMARRHCQSKLA